jgi:hypothetical protein
MKSLSPVFDLVLALCCSAAYAQTSITGAAQAAPFTEAVPAVAAAESGRGSSAADRKLFAEAMHLYKGGRWSAAYGRFMTLADRGDARAARIALAMLRDGPKLYGIHWDAQTSQVVAWEHAAQLAAGANLLVLNK